MKIALLSSMLCGLTVAMADTSNKARALDFVAPEAESLAKEIAGADVVIAGILYDGDAQANGGEGTTEVAIQTIIKDHPGLKNKKHFTLKRYVPTKNDPPIYFVLFGALVKGEIDVYRGISFSGKDEELVTYIKSVRKLETASTNEQLHFYFDHLDCRHPEIARFDSLRHVAGRRHGAYDAGRRRGCAGFLSSGLQITSPERKRGG